MKITWLQKFSRQHHNHIIIIIHRSVIGPDQELPAPSDDMVMTPQSMLVVRPRVAPPFNDSIPDTKDSRVTHSG